MHSALYYSGETDIQKSDRDVLYPSFEDNRAWKGGNSNHQKFMSTIYDENNTPTIDLSSSERNFYSILLPLENEVAQQEEKVRANIDELEKKPAKEGSVKVKVQTSKGNSTGSTRCPDRRRKQPAKLQVSADSLNHLAHVGTVVDVLWTEEELDGTNWKPDQYTMLIHINARNRGAV